jgi:hypothetical protein
MSTVRVDCLAFDGLVGLASRRERSSRSGSAGPANSADAWAMRMRWIGEVAYPTTVTGLRTSSASSPPPGQSG